MLYKIKELATSLLLRRNKKIVFAHYYTKKKNVGDLLHLTILREYKNLGVRKPPLLRYFKHYLIVGSILEHMNENSIVLGSGVNDINKIDNIKKLGDIRALRGHKTKSLIEDKFSIELDIPLGDFGLLLPRVYQPKEPIKKKYKFGLVLHYVDVNHKIKSNVEKMGGRIISVENDPEKFVDQILSCENILSSSMHGVILSDAYSIPNKRIILSGNIVGADFKFEDYYSTTVNSNQSGIDLSDHYSIGDINSAIGKCVVNSYRYDLDLLEKEIMKI
ncbi:polysaccharide pyruvyl transferase family protein [Vibrio breoganii]|uniref:Polysaccharide pyruvyl transferase domain-containing protein n=1 Tax=Vibrio breoganii TaxID=553239 RepID=A0ABX1UAD0_9VIBR|nr:polysaccharide pyruvyl transferase family protein [Vibrio breoganii]NMO74820.1 hypothetical protein [Vibrio breoganii]NMR71457.1 hypothetical protein [Vibrio breoganii]PML84903.1 hypothetical protein BCT67_15620 [Vibrio breoganii]